MNNTSPKSLQDKVRPIMDDLEREIAELLPCLACKYPSDRAVHGIMCDMRPAVLAFVCRKLAAREQSYALLGNAYVKIADIENDRNTLKGVIASDDKRLADAAVKVWGEHIWGCDTPDHLADTVLSLRQRIAELEAQATDGWRKGLKKAFRLLLASEKEKP